MTDQPSDGPPRRAWPSRSVRSNQVRVVGHRLSANPASMGARDRLSIVPSDEWLRRLVVFGAAVGVAVFCVIALVSLPPRLLPLVAAFVFGSAILLWLLRRPVGR